MAQYIQGHKFITIHHTVTAPAMTKADIPALAKSMETYHKTKTWAETFKTGGEFGYEYLSYHYLFALDGSYLQVHDTKYQRVHATDSVRGSMSHNIHGIAIAIVGNMSTTQPSAGLIEGIAKLCAQLEKEYKISFAIRGHKETAVYVNAAGTVFYPEKTGVYYTECPGNFMGTSKDGVIKQIINRTNQLLVEKPWYETVTKKELKLTNPSTAFLYNLDTLEKIKTFPKDSVVETGYQLGDYYLTAYSVDKQLKNGFLKSEWKEYELPTPGDGELEFYKKEVERLGKELKATDTSYRSLLKDLDSKNEEIASLQSEIGELTKSLADSKLALVECNTIAKRLENDIKWMEEQEAKLKTEIKKLEKSLEGCSGVGIEQMSWSEIFSGILSKLLSKKPE